MYVWVHIHFFVILYIKAYGCDTFNLNTERTYVQNNIEEKNHQKNRDMMSTYGFILYIIMIIWVSCLGIFNLLSAPRISFMWQMWQNWYIIQDWLASRKKEYFIRDLFLKDFTKGTYILHL